MRRIMMDGRPVIQRPPRKILGHMEEDFQLFVGRVLSLA